MTASTRALARHGVTISDDQLAEELSRALEALPGAPGSETLTDHEAAFLSAHGGGSAARLMATFDAAEVHRQQALAAADATARLLRGLLTREAAAALIGVDSTGVFRRIQDGRLTGPRTRCSPPRGRPAGHGREPSIRPGTTSTGCCRHRR